MTTLPSALRAPHSVSDRLVGWLTMARISNSPTVASNVLAGAALAGVLEPQPTVWALVAAMVIFYTAGMLLNDICDFRWDRVHRPDRPLVSGLVSMPAAITAAVGLFVLAGGLVLAVSPRAFAGALVLTALIVLYDVWHKSNPLSPLVMALCRLMVYVTAFAAFAWPPTPFLAFTGGLLVAYVVGLTAIAKSEVRPGVVGYWPAALVFLPAACLAVLAPVLALVHAAWSAASIRFVYRREGRRIGVTIARLIAGISLLDAVVLAAAGATWPTIGLALAAFALTLLLQRFVEGT